MAVAGIKLGSACITSTRSDNFTTNSRADLSTFRARGGRYLGRFFVGEDEVVEVDVDHVEAAADRQRDLADVVALSLPQRRRYAQVLKKTELV